MNVRIYLAIVLLTITSLLTGAASPLVPVPQTAYVEPALDRQEAEHLSVIVTGEDSQSAARAVERVLHLGHNRRESYPLDPYGGSRRRPTGKPSNAATPGTAQGRPQGNPAPAENPRDPGGHAPAAHEC